MNRVLITGRLTRDPEMRGLASGKNVTTFRELPNPLRRGGSALPRRWSRCDADLCYSHGV